MALERIQKILAKAGIASRREAERMILEGRIRVNGKVVDTLGFKADPSKDHIRVDGKRIGHFDPKITLMLNKPRGVVSTVRDPEGRKTVMDLLQRVRKRVFPIGRLDIDAEGLLLLTNDGDLAYLLSHPKFSVPKTYLVKVSGFPEERVLSRLKRGVTLEGGKAKAESIFMLRQAETNCWHRVVVTEGRTHLIKRMMAAVGHPVLKLKRIGFGPIRLNDLPSGQLRYLTPEETAKLRTSGSAVTIRRLSPHAED